MSFIPSRLSAKVRNLSSASTISTTIGRLADRSRIVAVRSWAETPKTHRAA